MKIILSALVFLLGGCAASQGAKEMNGGSLDFALIGDMPYDGRQEKEFTNLMKNIDAAQLSFVVHNGVDAARPRQGQRMPIRQLHQQVRVLWPLPFRRLEPVPVFLGEKIF